MEIKVREITDVPEKGVAEIEQQLLDKHEQQNAHVQEEPTKSEPTNELKEEEVLSYISKRYNRDIKSFDELTSNRENNEELPEEAEVQLAQLVAQASTQVLQMHKSQAAQEQNQQMALRVACEEKERRGRSHCRR